ncbi:MAG TPA: hypothetical protein VJH03_13170 [Blastocatellia bacterium]|nr:hypothetical protein [Blastocatellia bacterium]
MRNVRKIKPRVEGIIKRIDPALIVQATFYDEASDRFFVTIVDGPRKIEVTLLGREFDNGRYESVNASLQAATERLKRVPIG